MADSPDLSSQETSIHVAVGIILQDSRVCICLRPKHLHKGGLWEFPGGKIEQGETPLSALKRELKEEIGIHVESADLVMQIPWRYSEKNVLLEILKVDVFSGEAVGLEGQQVKWVELELLDDYQFPEANIAIVDYLLKR